MSEAFPGLPSFDLPVSDPVLAASVVLVRPAGEGVELFWLKRGRTLRFAASFWALPGGRVDAEDANVPVVNAEPGQAPLIAAAARELLEEVGVLVCGGGANFEPSQRDALVAGEVKFESLLSGPIDARCFLPAGRWVTPAFIPRRFDARFFLVEVPAGTQAEVIDGEASEGAWIRPQDALAQWEKGVVLLHPPQWHALKVLCDWRGAEDAARRLSETPTDEHGVPFRVEFQRGIHVVPLRTDTLPPATHTNAYVVGNGELLIVDPGADDPAELSRLHGVVDALCARGRKVKAIVLSHHHADHTGGVRAMAEKYGAPLWCHARTADRLNLPVERLLNEGDVLTLEGEPPMRLRVLHTPGHARGHLCLLDEESHGAIVGDMVSGVSTIVIDPPEGDMAEYLGQLARLRDLPVRALHAAHGPAIPDGVAKLNEFLEHRAQREAKVESAVGQGGTLEEITARAYDDTPEFLHPLAARSAEAHLLKLETEGRIRREGARFIACRAAL